MVGQILDVSLYGKARLCPCFPGYALAMHKNPSLNATFLYPGDHAAALFPSTILMFVLILGSSGTTALRAICRAGKAIDLQELALARFTIPAAFQQVYCAGAAKASASLHRSCAAFTYSCLASCAPISSRKFRPLTASLSEVLSDLSVSTRSFPLFCFTASSLGLIACRNRTTVCTCGAESLCAAKYSSLISSTFFEGYFDKKVG
jgi:hypothetical protein